MLLVHIVYSSVSYAIVKIRSYHKLGQSYMLFCSIGTAVQYIMLQMELAFTYSTIVSMQQCSVTTKTVVTQLASQMYPNKYPTLATLTHKTK